MNFFCIKCEKTYHTDDKIPNTSYSYCQTCDKNNSLSTEYYHDEERVEKLSKQIKEAILSNTFYDNTLHVISVISNICEFKRRWQLFKEFKERMEAEENRTNDSSGPLLKFYVVELAYGTQSFHMTDPMNPQHLQLRTEHALWHKENMINIGVKKLLPIDWKVMAWIDGDIEFENPNWVGDTLKVMQVCDVAQMFTTCFDLGKNPEDIMMTWISHGYNQAYGHHNMIKSSKDPLKYWHCGYGFAYSRHFWDRMGGIFDRSIIGEGDSIMCKMFLDDFFFYKNPYTIPIYRKVIYDYTSRVKTASRFKGGKLRVGYVPGIIRHYFHGNKKNRLYIQRQQIIFKHKYDPTKHLSEDENGILVPTETMPIGILKDLMDMFAFRNEDE